MTKKEVLEIRKQFSQENCAITRICGCYVDGEKNIRTTSKDAFLSLPEEEMFKYFEIFRKTLSGSIGKNLLNLEFPLASELEGQAQQFLLQLRNSGLKDDDLLDDFYEKVIQYYGYGENYYIILIHAAYDIPKRAKDGEEMYDSSEDVFEYLLCSICPVNLSKAGLCYNTETNSIEDRIRDWIVEAPMNGFLFPAFNERNTDLHGALYYSKNPEQLQADFVEQMLGCEIPLSAKGQKMTFNAIVEETLGERCDYETVRSIHEQLNGILEEHKDDPAPPEVDKLELKKLLVQNVEDKEELETIDLAFNKSYNGSIGEKNAFLAANITNTRKFEIKTPDVVVQVNPERTDLVETRCIDGKNYLIIEVNDAVEVNGISVRPSRQSDLSENVDKF